MVKVYDLTIFLLIKNILITNYLINVKLYFTNLINCVILNEIMDSYIVFGESYGKKEFNIIN